MLSVWPEPERYLPPKVIIAKCCVGQQGTTYDSHMFIHVRVQNNLMLFLSGHWNTQMPHCLVSAVLTQEGSGSD